MIYRQGRSLLFLFLACLILLITFFSLRNGEVDRKYESDLLLTDTPIYITMAGLEAEKEIFLQPQNPDPGDFLVVEAGPLTGNIDVILDFDFDGALSTIYRTGSRLYAVIAICYDNKPGRYRLSINKDSQQRTSKSLETAFNIGEKEFAFASFSMPASRTAGWTSARLAEDRENIRLARELSEPHPLWLQRFVRPLEGRITSTYGAIRVINNNPPRRHSGIDIGAPEGTPIVAANRGIVRLAEHLLAGGKTVIIDHGINLSTTYMHMSSIAVNEGQMVERGELIGTVGMTGYATGPHLHWEANIGHAPVNPEQLLEDDLLWVPPAYVEKMLKSDR